MPTLTDIADKAGVNVSTVSKALRGRNDVNPETRKRIIDIARELHYVRRGRSSANASYESVGAIGVICPEIRSTYYAQIVTALETSFQERGYGMLLGLTDFSYQREVKHLDNFRRQEVAGVVCITEQEKIEYDLRSFRSVYNIPVVVVATVIAIEDFDYVRVNDDLGVRMAAEHLVKLGHSRIGFVGDIVSRQRLDTFLDALNRQGVKCVESCFRIADERFEVGGYLRMKELLSSPNPPTAVLAAYDDMAIGAMRAVKEAGLSVPDDISIMGIDGIEVGGYLGTSLTTVAGHTSEMAEAASRILFKKVDNAGFSVIQHVEVNPELVIRQSTAPPGEKNM